MSHGSIIAEGFGQDRNFGMVREGFAAYTGLPEPPPAGYQYATCTTTSFTGVSVQQDLSPAAVVGDVFEVQLATSPDGFAVAVEGDGTLQISSGGSTAREKILYGIYRLASNALEAGGIIWDHEVPPVWESAFFSNVLTIGVPMISVSLAGSPYATSSEGDVLTFAIASGALPPGITLTSDGVLSGLPSAVGDYVFTVNATDAALQTTQSLPCDIAINVSVQVHPQKFTRHRGKTLVVLPYEDLPLDMTPAERAEQVRLDALREDMQGVFSGNQAVLQAHVDAYRAEQVRIANMSAAEKQVEGLFKDLQLQ